MTDGAAWEQVKPDHATVKFTLQRWGGGGPQREGQVTYLKKIRSIKRLYAIQRPSETEAKVLGRGQILPLQIGFIVILHISSDAISGTWKKAVPVSPIIQLSQKYRFLSGEGVAAILD